MLADDRHRLVLQPIVDLARGMVVGHEALSRFPDHPPNVWFNVANGEGVSDVLDARILDKALRLRSTLPPDTFVTINIEPANLLSAPVTEALDQTERLDRVILELTEHSPLNDTGDMQARMQVLRQRGALFALDDVGAGYAGLQAMLQSRPDVVKVDRSLVDHIDQDPAKQAMVHMLGELAGRMDAWLLAEGIERPEELLELIRMQVPLGQGYLLGRPEDDMLTALPTEMVAYITDNAAAAQLDDIVAGLVELVPHVRGKDPIDPEMTVIVVDEYSRPAALWVDGILESRPLRVKPSEDVASVAARMADRSGPGRLLPAVVIDGQGRAIGILRTNRLLRHMATRAMQN